MLDGKLIRDHTEIIKATLVKRYIEFPLDELLDFDKKRRILITEAQELKHERNLVSEKIVIKKMSTENICTLVYLVIFLDTSTNF